MSFVFDTIKKLVKKFSGTFEDENNLVGETENINNVDEHTNQR